jgi:hypothetical protein
MSPAAPGAAGPDLDLDLRVRQIRWHPDAARRVVSLELESRRIDDAREGDLVAGVKIEQIRPGSVQISVAGQGATVQLEP